MTTRREIIRNIGLWGVVKSVYLSLRHCGKPDKIVVGNNVLTRIDRGATVSVRNRLLLGATSTGASHPRLGTSKFTIDEEGTVNATSTEGPTNIGPNSIVHVEGVFEMGDSYINSHARILCGERITIGDGCAIAWNVELLDTDRHKLYVDGEQVGSSSLSFEGIDYADQDEVELVLGRHAGDGVGDRHYQGDLDGVGLWTEALSESQLEDLFETAASCR